ncbi:antitoxin family protein [Aeropyrum pernix]|uniref:antitoxin family protein n=1 Tax=Aeropyrum pernix TaxID=56636 RepID=UPI0010375352|nr:antitoxin family protein [Aeropyrum pernix]
MSKVIRVKYEKGVLKPLEPVNLEDGEEVVVVLKEDIVELARRIRRRLPEERKEPSEILSRERNRLE